MQRFARYLPLRKLSTSRISRERVQDFTRVPLCTPLAGEFGQRSSGDGAAHKPFNTEQSTHPSGLRVASEAHFGDYCTIGVAIESGSRYEAEYPLGTSHLIEKLAFGATSKHASRDEIYGVLEQNGGLIDCQSTKDTFIYAASCHVNGLDSVMEVIANAVLRPTILDEEFEEAKLIVGYENEDMSRKIECEPLLTDWIHKAAFRDNTLGFSKYTTNDALPKITKEHVFSFMSQYHTPKRIVVAGVGVTHSELTSAVNKHFNFETSSWAKDPKVLLNKMPDIDNSLAQYTGGEVRIQKDLSQLAVGTPYPNLAHMTLGFQGVGYKHADFVPFCVLQSLLGGGGSFSAGGPGKGMYTRLYTEVMNSCHWIYGATAYNHAYSDSGLFCVQASSEPDRINDVLIVILDQFFKLLDTVQKEELDRAKIQLKSQLMMNLEIRPVMFEDLARQIIGHGFRRKPEEYMENIDNVTIADIKRIGEQMLSHRPSLVGYGDIAKLAAYEALDDAVAKKNLRALQPQKKIFSWQ